jgi:hypothetical protein
MIHLRFQVHCLINLQRSGYGFFLPKDPLNSGGFFEDRYPISDIVQYNYGLRKSNYYCHV